MNSLTPVQATGTPLRTCLDCGLEAHTEQELDKFVTNKSYKIGKSNLCKLCRGVRRRQRLNTNDEAYLLHKLREMISRCENPNLVHREVYHERGIRVCQQWMSDRDSFVRWSLANGWKRGLWIERVNNDLGYSPENCKWVTAKENTRNRSNTVTDFDNKTRICYKCKKVRSLDSFSLNKHYGRDYICKHCKKDRRISQKQSVLFTR